MTFELTREDFDSLRLYFEDKRAEILSLARALCEVESPSGDGEGSAAVVNLLAEAAKSVSPSASVERISAPDGYGEHFILRAFDGAPGERALLLLGHTDTVHPRGTLAARPWRETEGRIYAPGVYDMKAACAIAFYAMVSCAVGWFGPRRPVVLLLPCDEGPGGSSTAGRCGPSHP